MNMMITPYNNYNRNYKNYSQQTFAGKMPKASDAETLLAETTAKKSNFFDPLKKTYDSFTDGIADKFTKHLVDSKPMLWLADKFKATDNLFQHCMTLGSVITSGLYMQRTLTNKNLDKDRRNTLAVNQGLTLVVSTIGAYVLDKHLKEWWENVSAQFAGHLLGDKDFYKNFKDKVAQVKAENQAIKQNAKGTKPELKSLPRATKFVEANPLYKTLKTTKASEAKSLMNKVKGMSPLRTMIVFGFVYRYFVPVVVTKPANKVTEFIMSKNKTNKTKKA